MYVSLMILSYVHRVKMEPLDLLEKMETMVVKELREALDQLDLRGRRDKQ